jgi:predicted DNA-binding transcriptional regulator YafY
MIPELEKLLDTPPIEVYYTNYKNETRLRRVIPLEVRYDTSSWHPGINWLLICWDIEKNAEREFELAKCDFTNN